MKRGIGAHAVAGTFWQDRKMRRITEDGRTLAIYLLTCPDRTAEGFYSLPRVLALDHLRWNAGRLDAAFIELADAGFAQYDTAAEVVFVVKGLKYNPPRARTSIKGAVTALDTVQDAPELFRRFLAAANHYAPDLAASIRGCLDDERVAPHETPL